LHPPLPVPGQSGSDLLHELRPRAIAEFIRKDKCLRAPLAQADWAKIDDTLRHLAKIPALPKGRGVVTGSSQVLSSAALGGAAAKMVGLPPEVGYAIGAYAPKIVAQAMVTDRGRAAVLKAMTERGFLDHQALATIAQVVRTTGTQLVRGQEDGGGTEAERPAE